MKTFLHAIIVTILLLLSSKIEAQEKITEMFQEASPGQKSGLTAETQAFSNSLKSAKVVSIDFVKSNKLYTEKGSYLVELKTKTETLVLNISPSDILGSDFKVTDAADVQIGIDLPTFYWGKIEGVESSFVTFSVFKGEVSAIISSDKYNYTIGKIKDPNQNLHIIYETGEIPNDQPFEAEGPIEITDADFQNGGGNIHSGAEEKAVTGCRPVEIYFEVDYAMYLAQGSSLSNVTNYVTNMFNNVSYLYAAEGVNVKFHSLKIWNTSDPYSSGTTSLHALESFKTALTANNFANFPATADLAHLISSRSVGGGVAYLYSGGPPSVYGGMSERSVLFACSKEAAFGFSGSMSTTIVNVPSFSWNIMVVTHELGHNLGLPHTHSCTWPGGAIDGCVAVEGSCVSPAIPTGGGTIMSYCHLRPVGINLSLGFGQMPGDKLRAEIAAANCLGGTPSMVPVAVNAARCSAGSLTVAATGCSGIYNWYNVAVGGAVLSTSASYTTPVLSTTTLYYVDCTTPANCTSRRVPVAALIGETIPVTTGATACGANVSVTLTASGCYGTYNWYSGASGGTSLGTGSSFNTPSISSTTDFYVSCTVESCVSPRAIATATVAPGPCYCIPDPQNCSDSDMITLVRIKQGETSLLNQSSDCSLDGYSYISSPVVTLIKGITYELTVNNPGEWLNGARAWIDYNGNGIFESSEEIFSISPVLWTSHSQLFTVPEGGLSGSTRMRVRTQFSSLPESCSNTEEFGETEDYLIEISSPCPLVLTLTHPIDSYSSGTIQKQASALAGVINAENRLTGNAKVTYESKAIQLNPGFTADSGTVFTAQTGGCN